MKDDRLYKLSRNIKSKRIQRGLTQEEMAEMLGTSRNTYISYETKCLAKPTTLIKIADLLNCSLSDFFAGI